MLEPLIDKLLKSLKIIGENVEEISVFLLGKYADCVPLIVLVYVLIFWTVIIAVVELGT